MALKIDRYEVPGRDSGNNLTVTFLYPHGAGTHSNRDLLRGTALLTGGLVLGVQTPGTGRVYIDRATRARLQHGRLADLAADHAAAVHDYLLSEGRSTNILVAHSGRVALGARMQCSPSHPFSHVIVGDGSNLCAPESVRDGYARLTGQKPAQFTHYTEHKTLGHRLRDRRARLHGILEVVYQGPMLCSTESVDAVTDLAADPTTPVLHFTLTNGICGSPKRQREFALHLEAVRHGAVTGEHQAPLRARILPGGHGDLQNSLLLDDHLAQVQALPQELPYSSEMRQAFTACE